MVVKGCYRQKPGKGRLGVTKEKGGGGSQIRKKRGGNPCLEADFIFRRTGKKRWTSVVGMNFNVLKLIGETEERGRSRKLGLNPKRNNLPT